MNNISIRMVENLFVDENGIYALSKQKERTKVFLRQGNLDYSCLVYSFLMMLILKGRIVRGDLERHYDHKGDELVEMIRKNLIYNLNGVTIKQAYNRMGVTIFIHIYSCNIKYCLFLCRNKSKYLLFKTITKILCCSEGKGIICQ